MNFLYGAPEGNFQFRTWSRDLFGDSCNTAKARRSRSDPRFVRVHSFWRLCSCPLLEADAGQIQR
jgi:hypothetical protein